MYAKTRADASVLSDVPGSASLQIRRQVDTSLL